MQAFLRLLHKDVDTPGYRDSAEGTPRNESNNSRSGIESTKEKGSSIAPSEFKSTFSKPVFNQEELRIIANKLEGVDPIIAKILKILKSDRRTDFEARTLYEHIQDFAFFQTFNERNEGNYFETEAFVRLCKNLKYERHLPGRVIFKEGEKANGKLYIVYSGEVSVVSKHENFFHKQNREAMEKDDEVKSSIGSKKSSPRNSQIFQTEFEDLEEDYDKVLAESNIFTSSPVRKQKKASTMILDNNFNFLKSPTEAQKMGDASNSNALSRKKSRQFTLKRKASVDSLSQENTPSDPLTRQESLTKSEMKLSLPTNPQRFMRTTQKKNTYAAGTTSGFQRQTIKIDINAINEKYQDKDIETIASKYGVVKDTIGKGGFFGEKALFDRAPRSATIIVNTVTELLVVNKADFIFVSENYDKKKKRLLEFMLKVFPELENVSNQSMEELIYRLEEKKFGIGDFICKEGDKSDRFYVLGAGQCQLLKTVILDETKNRAQIKEKFKDHMRITDKHKISVPLCWIEPGVFLGDEILTNPTGQFYFNVKVISTDAIVYAIDKPKFFFNFPKAVIEQVKTNCLGRAKQNYDLLKEVLSVRYGGYKLEDPDIENFSIGPVVMIPNIFDLAVNKSKSPPVAKVQKAEKQLELVLKAADPILSIQLSPQSPQIRESEVTLTSPLSSKQNIEHLSGGKKLRILNLSRKPYLPYSSDLPGTMNNPSNRHAQDKDMISIATSRESISVLSMFKPNPDKSYSPEKAPRKVPEVIRSQNEGALTWDEYYQKIKLKPQVDQRSPQNPDDILNLESVMPPKEAERMIKAKRIKAGLHLPMISKFPLTEAEKKIMPSLESLRKRVNRCLNHSVKPDESTLINTSRMHILNTSPRADDRVISVFEDVSEISNNNNFERFNLPSDNRGYDSAPFRYSLTKKKSQIKVLDSLLMDRDSTHFKSLATDVSVRTKQESERDDRSIGTKSLKTIDSSKRVDLSKNSIHVQFNPSSMLKRKALLQKKLKYKSLKPIKQNINIDMSKLDELKFNDKIPVSAIRTSKAQKIIFPNVDLATDPN